MPSSPFPLPELATVQNFIAADARAGRPAQWGTSTVVDENTGEPVIDRPLFDRLHAAAGIDAAYPVGNAGVVHVYGYWFSTAVTPYGYKRDRWQDGDLAGALGQHPDAFHLTDADGSTPLQRVTAACLPHLLDPAQSPHADVLLPEGDTRVVLVGAQRPRALIYGIRNHDQEWRLITTFPLAGDPNAVIADFRSDRRLRWNAAIA